MRNNFIDRMGVMFSIERNSEIISNSKGLINREQSTNRRYIGFYPGEDIQIDDWLINDSGDKYRVIDKETITQTGKPYQLKCFIETEAEYNSKKQTTSPVFNIGTAYGSVIGTQSVVNMNYNESIQNAKHQIESSNSADKEELTQIINLLEMVINNQVPPQKGLFSKFADVMERNSWITGSIASALLGWLTTQIPPMFP